MGFLVTGQLYSGLESRCEINISTARIDAPLCEAVESLLNRAFDFLDEQDVKCALRPSTSL